MSQGGGAQTRTFLYDAFGFLRSETTPEKGTVDSTGILAGTGLKIGSLGNVRERTEAYGTGSPQVHDLTYDAAGRVLTETVNSVQYLQNSYDQTLHGSSAGKLTQRVGYNPLISGQPTVTDSFTYSGLGGRLSSQQTIVTGAQSLTTTQSWVYSSLGLVGQHNHAQVTGTAPFVVTTTYDAGLPVSEYANGIPAVAGVGYRASGSLATYATGFGFGKNMLTTIAKDALFRPTDISTTRQDLSTASFDTGTYTYDGVGNIMAIGSDSFNYDLLSRLTLATLAGYPTQNYSYDLYGNLLTKGATSFCSGTCPNNRVTGLSAQYDLRGNLTSFTNEGYGYDGLNRTISSSTGYTYLFDAADERVVRAPSAGPWTFTLRDEGKRLSTEYAGGGAVRDNVYLGNLLVAAFSGSGSIWTFFASDHLGTPRLVTDLLGVSLESRKNWPFGEQVTTSASLERIRFAAMEQDTEAGAGNDRYNDHARQHGALLGRFLGPDQLGGGAHAPQSWNRYTYAANNPLKLLDSNGLEVKYANDHLRALFSLLQQRSSKVRATLARYSGTGSPDLLVQRGDAGHDPLTGEKSRGAFDPVVEKSYKKGDGYTVSDPLLRDQFPATGKNLTGAELKSATLTIDTSLTPGSKDEADVAVHELGHAEDAASDAMEFERNTADDMTHDENGKALPHDDRPEEQKAIKYRDAACGGPTRSCPQFPPH